MAFNSQGSNDGPMTDINMVPMIDVMLVLLIIFIVTAPLLTHQVKIELPKVTTSPAKAEPKAIQITIKESGEIFWNGEALTETQLVQRMHSQGQSQPDTEIHLMVDKQTIYEKLADVMGIAAREGITRIVFVTEPKP